MKRLWALLCVGLLAGYGGLARAAISDGEVRIALLTDMRGIYSSVAGEGAVIAAEMAISDFGGKIRGKPIKLIVADHKSNGEVALRLAQELYREQKVDAFAEMVSSTTALPIQKFARDNNIVTLHSGAASASLTSEDCSPTGVHWAYDTISLARGTAQAIMDQGGGSWFFITADYAFGHQLEQDTRTVVEARGGKVVGTARHAFKSADFSSQLMQAQASGAKVVALANAGGDTLNAVRQAYEFGVIQGGQSLAGLLLFITDIRQLGLYVTGGLKLTTGFYWNYDQQTRQWSERFYQRAGAMPTMVQASVYSSLMHYFKAIEATGTDEPKTVIAKMRQMPVNDFFARNGKLRADGRMVHDMYLVEVKKASESTAAWDYFKVLKVIPGEQAFRPMEEGNCPHVR
ncbi:MAG TPA: ABC transporter substrate-binding protein [Gammaproteobacteria bacterium]|nr:ABC transporter substrate-binding protein [Gammaproteobacteria bacterium]